MLEAVASSVANMADLHWTLNIIDLSSLFTIDQEGKNAMKHFNSEAELVDFASKERFPKQM